jgi:hypothetical protein
MGRTNNVIPGSGIHVPAVIKSASNAGLVCRLTKPHLPDVTKVEKWKNIDEILQRSHTGTNPGNIVDKA